MPPKLTKDQFIQKANIIHKSLYDYSKVEYMNYETKIEIICSIHGSFFQIPNKHLSGKQGCPRCGGKIKLTKEEFMEKAKLVHGNQYDYKVIYIWENEFKNLLKENELFQ